MEVRIAAISGVQVGFELFDEMDGEDVFGFLFIDLLILRILFAWAK